MLLDEKIVEQIPRLIGRGAGVENNDLSFLSKLVGAMVTGAGGSIGQEVSMQLAALNPKVLVLFELNEYALYQIERRVRASGFSGKLIAILGSVTDSYLVGKVLKWYKVELVIHAAAYKHVPLVELNPLASMGNNFIGTDKLAQCAVEAGVKKFLCISTDKAVNPTNIMGASKRLAEYSCLSKNGGSTVFTVVRFGNVMWSTGSVLPLFYSQLKTTKVMTITHPEVSRYFMSVKEATQLVLQSVGMGPGVFVFDMGEPVLIETVARNLADLMQVKDYSISYIGLRPGEKLYEELTLGENLVSTSHPRIMEAREAVGDVQETVTLVSRLVEDRDIGGLRILLQKVVPGYIPMCGIVDPLWLEENVYHGLNQLDDCYKTPSPEAV